MTTATTKLSVAFAAILMTGCAGTMKNAGNFIDSSSFSDDVTGIKYDSLSGAPVIPDAGWQKSCMEAKIYDPNAGVGLAGQAAGVAVGVATDSTTNSIRNTIGSNAFTSFISSTVNGATNSAGNAYNNQKFQSNAEECVQNYAHKGSQNGTFNCSYNQAFNSVVIKGASDSEGLPVIPKSIASCFTKDNKSGKESITRLNKFQMHNKR